MHSALRLILLLFGFGTSLCGVAWGEAVHVEAQGAGSTRDAAIAGALASAIQQATGVTIDVAQVSSTVAASVATDTTHDTVMVQATQDAIRRTAGGTVRSYRIISLDAADEGGFVAEVAVDVEVFKAKGLGNDTRRRIAVATFSTPGAQAGATADLLRDRIAAHLTQARRFAVVDRSQDPAYAQEMQLPQSGDTPLTERARLGQVIGADYVVTGKLRQTAATRTDSLIGLTGEVVTSTTAGSAEADYQVIEIATRQIKWAGTARISGSGAIDQVSTKIADEITQTIYPMRLIRFEDPTNLVINQGGDSLRPGQRFRAMLMGETMIDPYTHESLGEVEQQAGVVEIKRVDAKLSYARLVSGHLPASGGNDVQIVLRPSAPAATANRPARAAVVQEAPAVTKLPFDP
jgi:curli biogenesis system outer membrane secretion channel CsgG